MSLRKKISDKIKSESEKNPVDLRVETLVAEVDRTIEEIKKSMQDPMSIVEKFLLGKEKNAQWAVDHFDRQKIYEEVKHERIKKLEELKKQLLEE